MQLVALNAFVHFEVFLIRVVYQCKLSVLALSAFVLFEVLHICVICLIIQSSVSEEVVAYLLVLV